MGRIVSTRRAAGKPGAATASSISVFLLRIGSLCGFEGYAPPASEPDERTSMATLAFHHEEILPRELKPALYELDGISRETVEAHYKLYQGYVNKRNELLGRLAEVDLAGANQVYSDVRALKVDPTFAIGGIKNHEWYFDHLGGDGGDPEGAIGELIARDFGSAANW